MRRLVFFCCACVCVLAVSCNCGGNGGVDAGPEGGPDGAVDGGDDGGPTADCDPGSMRDCYSGPLGTADVGACMVGTETCNGEGTAWGMCAGEVLPSLEVPTEPGQSSVDEDCDSRTDETP